MYLKKSHTHKWKIRHYHFKSNFISTRLSICIYMIIFTSLMFSCLGMIRSTSARGIGQPAVGWVFLKTNLCPWHRYVMWPNFIRNVTIYHTFTKSIFDCRRKSKDQLVRNRLKFLIELKFKESIHHWSLFYLKSWKISRLDQTQKHTPFWKKPHVKIRNIGGIETIYSPKTHHTGWVKENFTK